VPSRAYLYLNLAIAAIAAAGVVVGLTLDTRTTPRQPLAQSGKPPVPHGLPAPAGAQIEAAFRNWPNGSIDAMQRLGLKYSGGPTPAERRTGAIVQYYRGIALFWAGYPSDAQNALEFAKTLGKNTIIQGRADNFLHPGFFQDPNGPGYPVFAPTEKNALLEEGSRLQAEGHQESAESVYLRAARAAPGDAEAQVAVGVALFDEDNLTPAFSHLGPLTARFPKSQIVRFYLGYLLAWTAQGDKALVQFKQAVTLGPKTEIGKASESFVSQIENRGSSTPSN
jgi:tetratricopeptide (TPR) repeat protein